MDWTLDKKRPLCPQICEQICILIATNELKPGDRLMSVREVALKTSVTPNTVQKSFEQLEKTGVIYSRRGSGWYVSETGDIAKQVLQDQIDSKTEAYLDQMRSLGLTKNDILELLKEERYE